MRPTLQSLDGIVIGMEEGSYWSFKVKSLLSIEMTLRLIVNFYELLYHSFIQYPPRCLLLSTWHRFRPT